MSGTKKLLRFTVLFLGGTANPEGGEAEAEAISAQASFPARRAREKTGVEKENGRERNQSQTEWRKPTAIELI